MLSNHQTNQTVANENKETDVKNFIKEIDFLVEKFGKTNDVAVQQALKELRDIKASVDQETTKRSRDWVSITGNILRGAHWMKIIIDFLQN